MGKYSVRGWQYWPERSEGQYRSRELNIFPYCPTLRNAVIDLLYDLHVLCHQFGVILYMFVKDDMFYGCSESESMTSNLLFQLDENVMWNTCGS